MKTLCAGKSPDVKMILASANSYFGFFRRADSHRLRQGAGNELLLKSDRLPLLDVSPAFDKVVLLKDTAALEVDKAAAAERKRKFSEEMAGLVRNKQRISRYVRRWRDLEDITNPVHRG